MTGVPVWAVYGGTHRLTAEMLDTFDRAMKAEPEAPAPTDPMELLDLVNAALNKALENEIYSGWYDACKVYAGVSTLDELGFDDEGNKIKE